jgi:2-polyprenyl-6-hydroxyphenyl methylase/3-demethylubiquinone-9 3-methyltransferase
VLSYAGSIWRGLDQLTCRVAPGGLLVLSVYNDQGPKSDRWRKRKRRYNALAPRLRPAFAALVWLPFEAGCAATGVRHEPRAYLRSWTHPDRGVSRWHDIVAWVGGYPFQVARPEPVIDRCRAHGFDLVGLTVSGGPRARTEFVFRRSGRGAARAE